MRICRLSKFFFQSSALCLPILSLRALYSTTSGLPFGCVRQPEASFCSDIDPTADWLLLLNMGYCFYTVGHIPLPHVELGNEDVLHHYSLPI